eukprot:914037-Pelagomonas_calceolata.AAC.2
MVCAGGWSLWLPVHIPVKMSGAPLLACAVHSPAAGECAHVCCAWLPCARRAAAPCAPLLVPPFFPQEFSHFVMLSVRQ